MVDPAAEFTDVSSLRAEALGEPGQRTFRILVEGSGSAGVIWLEKEQLLQLVLAIKQLMATLPEAESTPASPVQETTGAPPAPSVEFKVGKLVLGHDGASGKFVIDAHETESGEDDAPSVRFWSDIPQAKAFSEEALRVCAAGRPLCPLCGAPMDPTGHRCARANGHGLADLTDL